MKCPKSIGEYVCHCVLKDGVKWCKFYGCKVEDVNNNCKR